MAGFYRGTGQPGRMAAVDSGDKVMDAATVKQLLLDHLDDCEFLVQGEGNHYDIIAIGDVFEGLRPVRKQQLVYGALSGCIADGSVHAVNIRTFTRAEWQARDAG